MILTRLQLEDFRKFSGKVVIDGLSPGINLFSGANEAGKTTVATAVRTLFLDRYKAATLKHLVPWRDPGAQPKVEAEFAIGGDSFILRKAFMVRQRCELLQVGGDRLESDEAEERLAALLKFSRPVKGTGFAEHYGVPGLLWITQGQAQEVKAPVGNAAAHLRDALTQLSGAHVEGGEDVIINEINQLLGELVTESKRKPTGVYAEAIQKLTAAKDALQHLEVQEAQFQDDVERMVRLQAEHDHTAARKPWEALERQAAQAQRRITELRTAKSNLEQQLVLSKADRDKISLLEERRNEALHENELLRQLQSDAEAAHEAAQSAADSMNHTAGLLRSASMALASANDALALAQLAAASREWRERLLLQQQAVERLSNSAAQASLISIQIQQAAKRAAETALDADKLASLEAVDEEMRTLEASMQVHGTRIDYRLSAGASVTANGDQICGEGGMLLGVHTELDIENVGRITITVGAPNVSKMAARYQEVRVKHSLLLAELGIMTLPEGRQRSIEHANCAKEADNLRKMLKIHAPNGMDALKTALDDAQLAVNQLQEKIAASPDPEQFLSVADGKAQLDACMASVLQLEAAHRELYQVRTDLQSKADSLQAQAIAKKTMLESQEWRDRQVFYQTDLDATRSDESMRAHRIEGARKRVEELESVVSEGDAERFTVSATAQRAVHSKTKEDLVKLSAKLESSGASGLGEQLAHARASVEHLQRRHDELKRRTDALTLLADTMADERDSAVRQLQAPLIARLEYYFRRLFPAAQMTLDDSLCLSTVNRNGILSDLKYLSYGTQEQFGILARLAYADLLKDAGIPTLIILDDCCVHTDSARRQHIKRALLDAANRHQILLFTCHPEAWDDLGIAPRRVEELAEV